VARGGSYAAVMLIRRSPLAPTIDDSHNPGQQYVSLPRSVLASRGEDRTGCRRAVGHAIGCTVIRRKIVVSHEDKPAPVRYESRPVQIRFFSSPTWMAHEVLGKRLSTEGHGIRA
jgi:hypothetical protein